MHNASLGDSKTIDLDPNTVGLKKRVENVDQVLDRGTSRLGNTKMPREPARDERRQTGEGIDGLAQSRAIRRFDNVATPVAIEPGHETRSAAADAPANREAAGAK
ncbi:MAG: hypothetical protein U1F33_05245 [Alphaproteobacteria bacterium]